MSHDHPRPDRVVSQVPTPLDMWTAFCPSCHFPVSAMSQRASYDAQVEHDRYVCYLRLQFGHDTPHTDETQLP